MSPYLKFIIVLNVIISNYHCTTTNIPQLSLQSTNGKTVKQDRAYLDGGKRCQTAYQNLTQKQIARLRDASGRPVSGIYAGIRGNTLWYGSYGECQKLPDSRYCLTKFPGVLSLVPNETQALIIQLGVCMPDVCTEQDVSEDLIFFLNKLHINVAPLTKPFQAECAEDSEYTSSVVITIVFCGILIALCLLATVVEIIYDSYQPCKSTEIVENGTEIAMGKNLEENTPLLPNGTNKKLITKDATRGSCFEILNCFSCHRNIKFIMNTDVGKSDLTYLHGIRVLSLFWIILFHSHALTLGPSVENTKDSLKLMRRFTFMILSQGAYGVDTFFVLSGVLVMYIYMKKHERNHGRTSWLKFYFHRFWRLTPTLMFCILLVAKLLPFCGAGPVWFVKRKDTACSENWWTNLLYINNFVKISPDERCIGPTWYLAVDMQLFIISPIFLLIAKRYKLRLLIYVVAVVILTSCITTAVLLGQKDLHPLFLPSHISSGTAFGEYNDYLKNVYLKPYCRIPPYVMGMALGYVVYSQFSRKFQLKWIIVLLMWIFAVCVALADIYAPYNAIKEDPHVWTRGEDVIYGSLQWIAWGLFVVWLIFACHYNFAGPVKTILAAKFWIPLSRINYAAFLIHVAVMDVLTYNIEVPIHYTAFTTVTNYLSLLVLAYAIAFIIAVFVELPCANLEILFWKRIERK